MAEEGFRRRPRRDEAPAPPWVPKTEIGQKVASGEIGSLDQIYAMGKMPLELEIVDKLLPGLREEVLGVETTQRTTDCGRKISFRAIVAIGDGIGYVGIGAGKSAEVRPAIASAIKDAKRHLIKVNLGCGSWECLCGGKHTVPVKLVGRGGSVRVTIQPGPRGLGIAGNETVRKVLELAGVKDVWTFSKGRTRSVYNMACAVVDALDLLNHMKTRTEW